MRVQRRGDNQYDWALYDGAGRIAVEWYFRGTSALRTSVMLYHLESGSEEGSHLHLEGHAESCSTQSQDELYIVVTGEVVMTAGETRAVLTAGDAAYVPQGELHGVKNESDGPAELVLLFGTTE